MNTIDASVKFCWSDSVSARWAGAHQGNTTSLERYEEDRDVRVLHKVLNGRISLLRGHTTFQSADLKSVTSNEGNIRAHIEASPL